MSYVNIDGEVLDVSIDGIGPKMVSTSDREWYVFEDEEAAGEAAADYWRDMAENDKAEFRCIVGDESLITWALGEWGGPGNEQTQSLEEWFELVARYPEEQWAGYDGTELEGTLSKEAANELGINSKTAVFYRRN